MSPRPKRNYFPIIVLGMGDPVVVQCNKLMMMRCLCGLSYEWHDVMRYTSSPMSQPTLSSGFRCHLLLHLSFVHLVCRPNPAKEFTIFPQIFSVSSAGKYFCFTQTNQRTLWEVKITNISAPNIWENVQGPLATKRKVICFNFVKYKYYPPSEIFTNSPKWSYLLNPGQE